MGNVGGSVACRKAGKKMHDSSASMRRALPTGAAWPVTRCALKSAAFSYKSASHSSSSDGAALTMPEKLHSTGIAPRSSDPLPTPQPGP